MMRVLDCICHNEIVRAMGHGKEYEVKLTKAQKFFASFLDICPGEIRINPGRTPSSEVPRPATAA